MEPRSGRGGRYLSSEAALLCSVSICFFFLCALLMGGCRWSTSLDVTSSRSVPNATVRAATAVGRKILGEWSPGSYPPRCALKCGECTPCKPVHVTVPPGTPVTTEYYPEAWRCKCGDKLYMP